MSRASSAVTKATEHSDTGVSVVVRQYLCVCSVVMATRSKQRRCLVVLEFMLLFIYLFASALELDDEGDFMFMFKGLFYFS